MVFSRKKHIFFGFSLIISKISKFEVRNDDISSIFIENFGKIAKIYGLLK